MNDSELEEIRKQRLSQLQAQYQENDNESKKQEQVQEAKNSMLSQILDQSARARLNMINLSKPEKGKMIEGLLIQMAHAGQINKKLEEAELIKILENINMRTSQSQSTSVKYDRRRAALDSDDEF